MHCRIEDDGEDEDEDEDEWINEFKNKNTNRLSPKTLNTIYKTAFELIWSTSINCLFIELLGKQREGEKKQTNKQHDTNH